MATSPTSNWSSALDKLRDTFANLSAFRDWVTIPGATQATVAVAKTRTHLFDKVRSGLVWPFLLLVPEQTSYHNERGAFIMIDGCQLRFEMKASEKIPTPDAYYEIMNPVGLILEELSEVAGRENTVGFISDPQAKLMTPPTFTSDGEKAAEGSIIFTEWSLSWGTR
jgi:hypothetical protein